MSIETIFAHVSCSDLNVSSAWYQRLFDNASTRQPMAGLAEWNFTDSAQVQLFEDKEHSGHSTLTLGVLQLEAEQQRLTDAGLHLGQIEEAKDFVIVRLQDPDQNLVVLASAKRR